MTEPFHGAKIAILVGDQIVTILRDEIPTIPWPGYWDLPGGGRENDETPTECALRELKEELGFTINPARLAWLTPHRSPPSYIWFLAVELPEFNPSMVKFGDEGQEWRLGSLDWFLSHDKTIPQHKTRLRAYLKHRKLI
ncbi:MAG: NUDIX domain-containing protein [Boseongicola sp.]|nr:NUDIX hydrolase [Boseongicola sp.]NNL19369.1 NUDIX domain-containing protein [Boseongicola sp.]